MRKYNRLLHLLEQAGEYNPGVEYLNLSRVYSNFENKCKMDCERSDDVLCKPKCKVQAARDALDEARKMMREISQIPDPKRKRKRTEKLRKQIDKMRDKLQKNMESLDRERTKSRGGA
jgi:hypothetical protein